MALHDLGDDMLPVAVGWSARGTKFKPGDVEARWASFTQGGGVAWATVPAMARDVGANLRHITIRHRSLIPSTNGVTVQADGAPNGVAVRMDGAPNYPDWKMSKNGDPVAPLATRGNLEALIDWAGVGVHYDVYSRSVIALDGTREITNNVDARILDLAAKYQLPKAAVVDQIDAVAFDRSINKPLQWLEKLEKPKGDPLADWISQSKMVPEDCKTFEQIRPTWPYVIWSKFFIACCAAADQLQRTPNKEALHKFEQVVVIVSNQGMKKSTAIRGLLPPELRGYYGEGIGLDLSSKDSLLGATKFWIAELGELDATFRKSDIAALKAFLSKSGDEVRLPFGKRTEFLPRRTVYFASVNVREFLQDNTGNRRYLPIDISEPLAYSEELGKRIFAQAWHRYIGGDPWWLSVEEDAEARVRQAEHDGNPYIQAILENFDLSSARRDFKVKPGILLEALGLRGEAIGRARNSLKSALSHFNIRKATGSARDGRFYMLPPAYPDFAWKYAMAKNGERNAFTGGGEGCAEND
jgi:putative DNA primase/helicase